MKNGFFICQTRPLYYTCMNSSFYPYETGKKIKEIDQIKIILLNFGEFMTKILNGI